MTTRIEDIITDIRGTLADPDSKRYTDARLIELIDKGQRDLVKKSKLLRSRVPIALLKNTAFLNLPADCYEITRALVDGIKVSILSHDDMDSRSFDISRDNNARFRSRDVNVNPSVNIEWETDEGTSVRNVIYDRLERQVLRIYPILSDETESVDYILDDTFGVIEGITGYLLNDPFGVMSNLSTTDANGDVFSPVFGLVANISEIVGTLIVYYIRMPTDITTINTDPEIEDIWDDALKFYATGMALKDDLDTKNRDKGTEELGFYTAELDLAKKLGAKDSTRAGQFSTRYESMN